MVSLYAIFNPRSHQGYSKNSGLTLLEIIVVVMLVGLLVAIVAPTCFHFLRLMRLETAKEQIYQAMRKAQQNARLNRVVWEFGIRQTSEGQIQWAIYPEQTSVDALIWNRLDSAVILDGETSLREVRGIRRVQFNHLGAVNGQLGRVTLSTHGGGTMKRCVIVSTLLGALRSGSNQPKQVDGKYCR